MATIFTKIINGEIPCHKVAETDRFLAFLDIFPLKKGHTLVIPKVEVDYIYDLPDELLGDLIIFSKKVGKAIESVIPCKRLAVSVIGLEVPHAHIHLIPMNTMQEISFTNPKLQLTPDELAAIAKNIRNAME